MYSDAVGTNSSPQRFTSKITVKPWKTLLVDDAPEFLELLVAILGTDNRVELVGTASNGVEAIEAAADCQPDLVLMDVNMPSMDGLTAARLLAEHFPETTVLLMSADDSPQLRIAGGTCGARGFVYKGRLRSELAMALCQISSPE